MIGKKKRHSRLQIPWHKTKRGKKKLAEGAKKYQQSEKGKLALKRARDKRRDKDFASIFAFVCKKNKRMYIMSSKYTMLRVANFKQGLKSEKRRKNYPSDLGKDYEKYGVEEFEVKILEKCSPLDLIKKKKQWIKSLESKKIYNKKGMD